MSLRPGPSEAPADSTPNPELQLRLYRPADLDRLYLIDQACFPPGISYSKRELKRFVELQRSRTWLAELDGEIAGFVVMSEEPHRVGHVITLDVIEARRRAGLGRALMDAAEDWARRRNLRLIYLETAETNRPAQLFYAVRGYVKVEEVEDYYGPGLTAWVMVRWLAEGERRRKPEARSKK